MATVEGEISDAAAKLAHQGVNFRGVHHLVLNTDDIKKLREATGCGVLVNLGGDLSVAGQAPPGGWRVAIADDHAAPDPVAGPTVSVTAGGLATSGTTVRTCCLTTWYWPWPPAWKGTRTTWPRACTAG